jgi:SH3 domain protein
MKRVAIGILGVAAMAAAQADPLYISDKLVVNMYADADQESNKVATLDSGDAVESIEKMDAYTHVRLADNREGWIKSSYLTAQVPAVVRLKELEKERGATASASAATAQLSAELKQSKEQNAVLQTELAAAKQAARSPAPTTNLTPPTSKRTEVEQVVRNQELPGHQHLGWIAGLGFLCVTIGFALGYQTLARRIRRKYGSVRIY